MAQARTHDAAAFHKRMMLAIGAAALIAGLALIWKVTPAAHYLSPRFIAPFFAALRHSPLVIPALLGIYVLGTLVCFPLTILIVATAMAFPAPESFFLALAGALCGAGFGYGAGRMVGLGFLHSLIGTRAEKIRRMAKSGGVAAVTFLRLMPVAPLGVVDLSLGIARVPFPVYIGGTVLGLLPGTVAFCFLGHSLARLWQNRSPEDLLYVGAGIAAWLAILVLVDLAVRRKQAKDAAFR